MGVPLSASSQKPGAYSVLIEEEVVMLMSAKVFPRGALGLDTLSTTSSTETPDAVVGRNP